MEVRFKLKTPEVLALKCVVLSKTKNTSEFSPFHRLDCEVEIPIPTITDRCEILQVCLDKYAVDSADVQRLAEAAHGFVAADLQCLVTKSVMRAVSRGGLQVTTEDLAWGLSQIKPSAMREVLVHVPKVREVQMNINCCQRREI